MALGLPTIFDKLEEPNIGERIYKTPRLADQYSVSEGRKPSPVAENPPQYNDQFDYETNDGPIPMNNYDDSDNEQQPNLDPPNEKACTRNRDAFCKYTAHARQHNGDLTTNEQEMIHLMTILHKNKAPLSSYDALVAWNLRSRGLLKEHEKVGSSPYYIGRKSLIQKLAKRYHMEDKKPQVHKFVLPSSKAKINVVTLDFCDQLEQILTFLMMIRLHLPQIISKFWAISTPERPTSKPTRNLLQNLVVSYWFQLSSTLTGLLLANTTKERWRR